jgi:hypothetical protein
LSGSIVFAGSLAASCAALLWQNLQKPSDSLAMLTHLPGRWPCVLDWQLQRTFAPAATPFLFGFFGFALMHWWPRD